MFSPWATSDRVTTPVDALALFYDAVDRQCAVDDVEDVGPVEDGDGGVSEGSEGSESLLLVEPLKNKLETAHEGADRKILSKKEQRDRLHKRGKRATQRRRLQEAAGTSLKRVAIQRAVRSKVERVGGMDLAALPHASTGYIGRWRSKQSTVKAPSNGTVESLEGLKAKGFRYIPWNGDGMYVTDCADRVIIGGGTPRSPSWNQALASCIVALKRAREISQFTSKQCNHRRGRFPAVAAGFAYGLGQLRPTTIVHEPHTDRALAELLADASIRRIAGFQSSLLLAYAPRLWEYYRNTMDGILEQRPELQRNFEDSVFASITFNFGPRTVTVPHIDYLNLAGGLCAITSLGDFDPDLGGHLILWDLRMVVRFPPGATILIPSALVRHSNVPIQRGEQRYSITQYTSGGLFRWADNGFCSDADRDAKGKGKGKAPEEHWGDGLSRFETR